MSIQVPEKLKPFLIWFAVTAAIKAISPSFSGLSGNLSSLFTGVILIYTPCLFYWYRRKKMDFLRGKTFTQSLFWFLAVALASSIAYVIFLKIIGGRFLSEKIHLLSKAPSLKFWLSSFIVVALPEEFFFRGFLYEMIEGTAWKKIVVTSILFSITHVLIGYSLLRLLTVIPGIALGYLRHRTGEIFTPAILHNFFNLIHWASSL